MSTAHVDHEEVDEDGSAEITRISLGRWTTIRFQCGVRLVQTSLEHDQVTRALRDMFSHLSDDTPMTLV